MCLSRLIVLGDSVVISIGCEVKKKKLVVYKKKNSQYGGSEYLRLLIVMVLSKK
jgi:hypothetical protein